MGTKLNQFLRSIVRRREMGILYAVIAVSLNGCVSHAGSAPTGPSLVPEITSISPNTIALGSAPFTLTVNGSNFNLKSVVEWNGHARATTYVSGSQLKAAIMATDVLSSGTASIRVFNPDPGGGTSPSQAFTIPGVTIQISPDSVTMAANEQQQFTATVTNAKDTTVKWQVSGVVGGTPELGLISVSGLYTANSLAKPATITAISAADSSKTASASIAVLPRHSISVRPVPGANAEFYSVGNGTSFVPRGNNYVRLAQQTGKDGTSFMYHSTFNVGVYDPARIETALTQMQQNGYNVVRVWLNGCCRYNTLADPGGGGRCLKLT